MKNRFVVYWRTGTNIHHYFETYDEAKKYIVNNEISGCYIAYLLSYVKSDLVELDYKLPSKEVKK